ncbi:MAG TPA: phosphoenolpyruvate--protein phosphotransferase [Chloroflexaceae bacterium]|nr:phosphoenolpyruvate--protein phosphotransferase [Chloroflexaceae bacterium]
MPANTLRGLAAAPGIAIGPALVFAPAEATAATAADPAAEQARLAAGVARADAALAAHEATLRASGKDEEAEIFAAHRLILADPSLSEQAQSQIAAERLSAEAAVEAAAEAQALELESLGDEYLSARAADLRDVAAQVRRALTGERSLGERLAAPAVVVARDLGPSDLMSVPRERLLGFALAAGGLTAHSSILARGLGIPAVVGLGEGLLAAAADGATLALDGAAGSLAIDPPADELARLREAARGQAEREAALRADAALPAVTRDGRPIALVANASTAEEARAARGWGAAGVGLLRTELLFLERPTLPDEEEQLALYRAVAAELPDAPITVRTLDVGGDKHLPAFPLPREENPFLGWRGIRIGLSEPERILLPQLRALLRAGAEAPIRIMLPMVSTPAELAQARALLARAAGELAAAGTPHAAHVELGVMIEVPAAALSAHALAREADFFSIGTNDLTQYTMACDRGNSRVAALYQPLDPAVLRLIRMACEAAHAHGRHAAVCGELGGDPRATALLIGLGVDELSCAPAALPHVRAAIRATDGAAARALAEAALAAAGPDEVQKLLAQVHAGERAQREDAG